MSRVLSMVAGFSMAAALLDDPRWVLATLISLFVVVIVDINLKED